MVTRGFQSASHPILAQIVPIRRCNLACTYRNEYDKHSPPVTLSTCASASTTSSACACSAGRPLSHRRSTSRFALGVRKRPTPPEPLTWPGSIWPIGIFRVRRAAVVRNVPGVVAGAAVIRAMHLAAFHDRLVAHECDFLAAGTGGLVGHGVDF